MNVLLIDDHPLILSALRALVQSIGEHVSVAAVASAKAAHAALATNPNFDIVLLDLQLGADEGIGLLAEIRSSNPDLPVIVLGASDNRDDLTTAIGLGARGFIPRRGGDDAVLGAINIVMAGGIYLPASIITSPTPSQPNPARDRHPWDVRLDNERAAATVAALGLTPRQKQVLSLLLRGQSNKLIARALNLSVETIKGHVAAILRSLNVTSRTQAVLKVSRHSNAAPAVFRQRAQ